MKNKVALEEHFATEQTIGDSQEYFGADIWPTRKSELLDVQQRRLQTMDECGIEYSILSLNSPAVQSRTETRAAIELAKRSNDELAEHVTRDPDRFGAFAALPLQDPESAAQELTRAVRDL